MGFAPSAEREISAKFANSNVFRNTSIRRVFQYDLISKVSLSCSSTFNE